MLHPSLPPPASPPPLPLPPPRPLSPASCRDPSDVCWARTLRTLLPPPLQRRLSLPIGRVRLTRRMKCLEKSLSQELSGSFPQTTHCTMRSMRFGGGAAGYAGPGTAGSPRPSRPKPTARVRHSSSAHHGAQPTAAAAASLQGQEAASGSPLPNPPSGPRLWCFHRLSRTDQPPGGAAPGRRRA